MKSRFILFLSIITVLVSTCFGAKKTVPVWKATELEFQSEKDWNDAQAFNDVTMDVTFTSEKGTVLVVPAFWDGGKTWRVRFAPTELGTWTFKTTCTPDDAGLNAKSGTVKAVPYTGELEIYKHGFVTTKDGLKYFVYADGMPFFYLGDTHWGMFTEEFDEPGPRAGDLKIQSHFRYLVDRRVEQGFTVYQSEPIGNGINYTDGISAEEIKLFQNMDRYFIYLAQKGLVHANSQFFFPNAMKSIQNNDKYLERLSRYWVARYSAYPVMWTLGQEVDDNFYDQFDRENNPYVKVCQYMHQYDPYHHPMTAHQENVYGHTTRTGVNNYGGKTKPSRFANAPGHTWYGIQWSTALNRPLDFAVPKDYWDGGKGKPAILYEGKYCYLWTKDFGARAQGWYAFLTGLYGYGYGAADIWLYKSRYDMGSVSRQDGVSAVTPEEKAVPWSKAVEFPSAIQMGYLKTFLQKYEWWKLTPDFDGTEMKFVPQSDKVFYAGAHEKALRFVLYFYSTDVATGKLENLQPGRVLKAYWFNPQTGSVLKAYWFNPQTETSQDTIELTVSESGSVTLPNKPNEADWVLYIE